MADDSDRAPSTEGAAAAAAPVDRAVRTAHMASFSPPGHLKVKGDLAQNWREWRQLWNAYEVVAGLSEASRQYRVATFITCIGPSGLRIYNVLPFANEDEKQQMDKVLQLFERHCLGETNIIYERFTFNRRDQVENENFDTYLTALREQVRRCEFQGMEDEMLRDRIVCGVGDNALRRQLLQKKNLTLQSCVDMCRASEATAHHLRVMGGGEDLHKVQTSQVVLSSLASRVRGTEMKARMSGLRVTAWSRS